MHSLRFKRFMMSSLLGGLLAATSGPAIATVVNGDFETGDFDGWTIFTFDAPATPAFPNGATGTAGPTAVVPFDVDGNGAATNAARFQVGQVPPGQIGGGSPRVGGGLLQNVSTGAGPLSISMDIASSSVSNNSDGGLFELLLDGSVLDVVDFGGILAGDIERDVLAAVVDVTAGVHELVIRMSRGFGQGTSTPFQYLDNVVVANRGVPEPLTLVLLGSGLALAGAARRRRT